MVRLNNKNREQYAAHIVTVLRNEELESFREAFLDLHPVDRVEIFETLDKELRNSVYHFLDPVEFAEIFQAMEVEEQKKIILELNEAYSSEMFNSMYADDVADFLTEVKGANAANILTSMNKVEAAEVKELLSYDPETAGAIMTKEFISIGSTDYASSVIELLRNEGPDAETIYYLYVVDEEDKLAGVVSLRDLIIAPPTELVRNIMSTRVVSVLASTDQEEVAKLIKKYDFLAAPVVTEEGKLVGIVTVDDVIDVFEEEATEDFGEFTAAKGATDVNISSFGAAKKRSPWIILLMFFGLITAGVIGNFEDTLEEIVLLAVFIPLIMDSAGNTGTQSLAVMVRSLATGSFERKGLLHTVKREFGTGIMLGLFCAVTLMAIIPIIYGSYVIAMVVGASLFITLSLATIVGAVVPVIINKLKLDPAIASGPFITTVNDIMGLLIYFSIATAFLDVI
ncbi:MULTISPECIES: magnesium transporter [Bacillaceae]|uniref:Magnesium transporter MgtE n=1 Tax=Evansella alkalicola TaxID=745819 RepID=A0ABS6JQI0_9BACI|nr:MULTISPECIES: magnesium transporter [Bacillaceae]MBU9720808.1 magnesium transporter [Bacillus alkalicola]